MFRDVEFFVICKCFDFVVIIQNNVGGYIVVILGENSGEEYVGIIYWCSEDVIGWIVFVFKISNDVMVNDVGVCFIF